ncbi:MAG: hypothetical protein IID28_02750 [Planctomycetes bacterium]|nr:hypothetical protein [Planctomycetota bacterium]
MRGAGATTTIPALLVAAATAAGTNAQPAEVTDPVAMAERAVSLGDQAVDVLTGVPPVEWLTSLFGVPSQEQRQRALHAAGEIYRLAGEADIEVRRAVAAIESGPGYAHDIAAQFQRRRLVDNERRRRIPMLLGVGAYLHAALSPQLRERQELYEEAIDLLTNLMKNPSLPFAAKVKLYAGLANVGAEHFETASPLLRGVPALPGADRWDVFASRMGQVSVVRGLRGIDPALAELDAVEQGYGAADPFRILIADRRFRLLSKAARDASGDRGTALLRRAFEAYAALLAEDPVPDNARIAVMERLSRSTPASPSWSGSAGWWTPERRWTACRRSCPSRGPGSWRKPTRRGPRRSRCWRRCWSGHGAVRRSGPRRSSSWPGRSITPAERGRRTSSSAGWCANTPPRPVRGRRSSSPS